MLPHLATLPLSHCHQSSPLPLQSPTTVSLNSTDSSFDCNTHTHTLTYSLPLIHPSFLSFQTIMFYSKHCSLSLSLFLCLSKVWPFCLTLKGAFCFVLLTSQDVKIKIIKIKCLVFINILGYGACCLSST